MAESEDSEGEELGLIRPKFIRELRNVLDEYPDDGQILKEMIQNAEDAGASMIKIFSDRREFNGQPDKVTLKHHPHLKYFKGPALCVYNDAYFTDADWKGIRMLHTSIKEKDPMKVGRFGLGFKSVFHLTDRLVILSGDRIMYMDPFKGEDRYCNSKRLSGMKGKELQSILYALKENFDISEQSIQTGFHGTVFWFPLRSEASELSETLYTDKNMDDLINSFRAEARSMVLFLKNIENIHLISRSTEQPPREIFHVGIHSSCLQQVRAERKAFIDRLKQANGTLPQQSISSQSDLVIEIVDHLKSTKESERWILVNFYPGMKDVSPELSSLCTDPNLAYQPFVGVAMPVGGQDDFQSNLFCFLPLPLDTKSPTGLPVHINGFFALSQNRRHIKWPTADQQRLKTHLEPAIRWNCLLVENLLPQAYIRLLYKLKELFTKQPEVFYSAWPDFSKAGDKWKPLLRTLYREIVIKDFFFTKARGGSWIIFASVELCSFPVHLGSAIEETIVKVYSLSNENLVKLPRHIEESIQQLGFKPACSSSPQRVAALANKCLPSLNTTEKLNLLQYLLTYQNPSELLNNLQLLPLEDGTFGKFNHDVFGIDNVYWCDEKLMEILPGLENLFCSVKVHKDIRAQLLKIARTNAFSLRELHYSSNDLPRLMKNCLDKRFGKRNPLVPIDDKWIEHVWNFFLATHPWCNDLASFSNLSLLPVVREGQISLLPLNGIYVCCNVSGITSPSKDLVSCLAKLQITMLPNLPNYTSRHSKVLGHLVQYPNPEGIIAAVRKVCSDNNKRLAAIKEFNSSATYSEREALIGLLNTKINICGIELLFQNLKLFTDIRARVNVSVREINVIAPQHLPPVTLPKNYLMCSDQVSRHVAKMLGASEESFEEIVETVLHLMKTRTAYTPEEITKFMKYFLGEIFLVSKQNLLSIAREVKFLPMASSQTKSAQELYDPCSQLLKELFLSEDRFPCGEFAETNMLSSLRKLGLKTEKIVNEDDLIATANKIQSYLQEGKHSLANTKAQALWKFVVTYGNSLSDRALQTIANIQCLPCLQKDLTSTDYPKDLPLMSQPAIVKPRDMGHSKHIRLIGTVLPLMPPGMPDKLCQKLGVDSQVNADKIVQHQRESIKNYISRESSQYQLIFCEIFRFLSENCDRRTVNKMLQEEACILIESEGRFARPNKFWIQKNREDIDLTPYRYLLSREMSIFQDLFVNCGSRLCQDKNILCDVLSEIQEKHKHQLISHNDFVVDMRLVNQILDVLKRSPDVVKGNVIIPIWHGEPSVLRFRQAKDCTIGQGNWQLHADTDNEEEIFYVHPDIPQATASLLGALNMKARALTGAEELDFGYGQHEELINRLHNLLKDSYTDGFSVPKEMIQNADDAGATECKILLDERENKDARTNLITEQMASLQGPAIWVFNNAVFSDEDFKNIVKLGGGTKKDDAAKVGKFGLGFNSVYNLTDAPSFISRHVMAMFDPQVKYLEGPGLKLDFKKSVNCNLLKKMPEIFKPFQNVFGCRLDIDNNINYKGTLFRFPLRTPEQAEESKLKAESYTDTKRKEFLRMLLERAGNLLLFTQNIKNLEVYYLPKTGEDPSLAQRLLIVKKHSERELIIPKLNICDQTILKFCTTHWPSNQDIKIQEDIEIEMETAILASEICKFKACRNVTHWRVAWASGTDQSAKIAKKHKQECFIPLAAAAVPMHEGRIVPIANNPAGFYTSGHLFCFLPLPEEMVNLSLPVHLNATFALSSSRRGLLLKTEDDFGSTDADWNSALFADAICRAYLLLLETMQRKISLENDFSQYFHLWPTEKSDQNLTEHFYKHLVSDGNKVFPTLGGLKWISFNDAWFLDPDFRSSACGDIAMETLRRLWDKGDNLVDVPKGICDYIKRSEHSKIPFQAKIVTEVFFYKDIFFPSINKEFWTHFKRDKLVHHALMGRDPVIQDLVRNCPCIPCRSSDVLRKPTDLIHPHKLAAKLFLEVDGHFPQDGRKIKTNDAVDDDDVNFSTYASLERLARLGMITDNLPETLLLERARSISALCKETPDQALERSYKLITYLSVLCGTYFRLNTYSTTVKEVLSKTEFLPIQSKPDKWTLPWGGGNGEQLLAAPEELFYENFIHLVACSAKILDLKFGNTTKDSYVSKEVLRNLGVKTEEKMDDLDMIKLTIKQLLTVAEFNQKEIQTDKYLTHAICSSAYTYLNKCCKETSQLSLAKSIADQKIVWTGNEFVLPAQVAFSCKYDCRPYLFQLENPLKQHIPLCETLGITKEFTKKQVLCVIEEIHRQNEGRQLPQDTVHLISRMAQLLCEIVKKCPCDNSLEHSNVYLPDRQGYLQCVAHLCLDDCPWLMESDIMKFVHDTIPPETATSLGVQSKRSMDYDSISDTMEFGQNEKLTTRIKRLLEGYTCDFSLFKELVQNADDAGATEIKFIKDFRCLRKERVPVGWEALQGPALCVYNNKSFTSDDIKGIQSLGEGSKSQDILKTGKYGVGFNAVYHLTDVPSFWTRENGENEVVCVFDPNCKYVAKATPQRPGIKFINIDRLRQQYPDMFSGYLGEAIEMSSPGALFRLPLRTQKMAENSQIKNDIISEEKLEGLLNEFRQEISICLLFLNNLKKIGIYTVNECGSLIPDYEVTMTVDETCSDKLTAFNCHLQEMSKGIKDKLVSLENIPAFEAVLKLTLKDIRGYEEDWVVVNRAGFTDLTDVSETLLKDWHEDHFQLLPRGGVALKLADRDNKGEQLSLKRDEHLAFCILPLPVETKLPVHVNGHFALDHETRRNLWNNKSDARTEWNERIAAKVIVPAYITALKEVKEKWFGALDLNSKNFTARLQHYHLLFPDIESAESDFWKTLMKELYKQIAQRELSLFPVTCAESLNIEWVPAIKKDGFPGYFQNLIVFFKTLANKWKASRTAALTNGPSIVGTTQTYNENWSNKKANVMLNLLKDLNMKVLESPFTIFENFKKSGIDEVRDVTSESVIQFLKSVSNGTRDGCNLTGLPRDIKTTSLKTTNNLKELFLFVHHAELFMDKLEGLPLCLRQSENLYLFQSASDSDKPMASEFYRLLPGSVNAFLHKEIYPFFVPLSQKSKLMIKDFDIQTLAQMIPFTLDATFFKTGLECNLDFKNFPFSDWLKILWKFLNSKLVFAPDLSEKDVRTQLEVEIACLSDWSLIPVKKRNVSGECSLLFPLKDHQSVVYLSKDTDESNPTVWEILKSFPLAFLNMDFLPKDCSFIRIVASISNPSALLNALASLDQELQVVPKQAQDILAYFSSCLSVLRELCSSENQLQVTLKKLPFYTFADGKTGSLPSVSNVLCLSDEVPYEGLRQWSQNRLEALILLRKDLVPEEIRNFLGFKIPTIAEFYYKYILPTFSAIQTNAIEIHMKFLRDHFQSFSEIEKGAFSAQLQQTAFIDINGRRCRACEFYSHLQPVFREMCPPELFPPPPYSEYEWTEFMKIAGIMHVVTDDMFVGFARQLENEGHSGISRDVIRKSDTLVCHLFERHDLIESSLLYRVKSICFVLPSPWQSTSNGQILSVLVPPYSHDRLVSFSESCQEHNLYLVWSSSCILHPDADPYRFNFMPHHQEVLKQLDFSKQAPKEKVVFHITNVCLSLAKHWSHETLRATDANIELMKDVMTKLYEYFGKNANAADIKNLKDLPIICNIEKKQMLKPENVVLDLREEEEIEGYIERAPIVFGAFFEFFKKLGVAQRVSANHYATVLLQLKERCKNESLHVEEMKIVQKAIRGLFLCLQAKSEEQNKLTVSSLFLPGEDRCLWKSTELIFDDKTTFRSRLKSFPHGKKFFISFPMLEINFRLPAEEVERLPEQYKMKCLSQIVKEVIPESIKPTATDSGTCRVLNCLISDPVRIHLIIRLIYHMHRKKKMPFTEDNAKEVINRLKLISSKEVSNLQTVLTYNDTEIEDSFTKRQMFVDKSQRETRQCTIYFDSGACQSMTVHNDFFILCFYMAIKFVLKEIEIDKFWLCNILRNGEQASYQMDQANIAESDLNYIVEQSIFPPPGTFIPVNHHCHLDNSFYTFYEGEHVGYEVHDAAVDDVETEEMDAIFIYAIVLQEIDQGSSNVPLSSKRYLVDLGKYGGVVEVSVTRLYKFFRRNTEDLCFNDLNMVLREIQHILIEAWKSPDEKERMRVVKRLYLKWHPDKNKGNEEFCTRVVQAIQRYVALLKSGKSLDTDDGEDVSLERYRSSSSSFFAHMGRRAQRYSTLLEEYEQRCSAGGGNHRNRNGHFFHVFGQSSEPNPQPQEGRRWFRQAQADLSAALEAKEKCTRGHNWICYQCQQACEKALKTLMYYRGSSGDIYTHELASLATWVGDSSLQQLAGELESCIGFHTRMRYPDVVQYPKIPADIYTADQAARACDICTQILKRTQELM